MLGQKALVSTLRNPSVFDPTELYSQFALYGDNQSSLDFPGSIAISYRARSDCRSRFFLVASYCEAVSDC